MPTKTYFEFQVLAQKLIEFKERNNLTYQEIGDATGVDKSHIHRVVNMETFPSFKFLIQLAHYMGVPLYSLFVPTEEMLRQLFTSRLQSRMAEWQWELNELADASGIGELRIREMLLGQSLPTLDEQDILHRALQLEPIFELNPEANQQLFLTSMAVLEISDNQKNHILQYLLHQTQ